VSGNQDRDKTVVVSWADLSPFVIDIWERLELAGLEASRCASRAHASGRASRPPAQRFRWVHW